MTISDITAYSAAPALYAHDIGALDEVLTAAHLNSEIRFMIIADSNRDVIAEYNVEIGIQLKYDSAKYSGTLMLDNATILSRSPILYKNLPIGNLYVGLSMGRMLDEIERTKMNFVIISIIILLVGLLSVYFAVNLLTVPLESMAQSFQQIENGDFSQKVSSSGYSEFNRLSQSFNHMVTTLASVQNELHTANLNLEQRVEERTNDLQRVIQKQNVSEEALRESEERYRLLVDLSPDAIAVHSADTFLFVNRSALKLFGVNSIESMLKRSLFDFLNPEQTKQFRASFERILHGKSVNMLSEFIFIRDDATEFNAEVAATKHDFRKTSAVQVVIRDVSDRFRNERKRLELEQQLLHVQKKEIVSTLASGLAHDILNILGIIGTSVNKLLFMKHVDHTSLIESADQISKASERGKSLVRQLLTFAKKTELNFDSIQINTVIMEIASVIQRTFPSSITIETILSYDLPHVRADQNQLHQALLNLCLNARDAVQKAGTITIETSINANPDLEENNEYHSEYICISVTDDGIGMNDEVMNRIYEPFFTTKKEGTGSGLGLSMVKGIMDNHRGSISIDTAEGKGTSFKLYFPV